MLQEARKHAEFLARRDLDSITARLKAFGGEMSTETSRCIERIVFQNTRNNVLHAKFLADVDRVTAYIKAFVDEWSVSRSVSSYSILPG